MKKTVLLCISAIALLINSCNKDTAPAVYLGNWQLGDTQLSLKDNNTYTLTNATLPYTGSGTYKVGVHAVDEIILNDKASVCADSIPGVYKFKYQVTSDPGKGIFFQYLTLSVTSDTCAERAAVLPGTYSVAK